MSGSSKYPTSASCNAIDDYHGTPVADSYRWLEDLGSAQTNAWIDALYASLTPAVPSTEKE